MRQTAEVIDGILRKAPLGKDSERYSVHVKAISALDGSLLWTSPAIASTLVEAPIIVADGVVLAIGINSADNPVLYEFAPS